MHPVGPVFLRFCREDEKAICKLIVNFATQHFMLRQTPFTIADSAFFMTEFRINETVTLGLFAHVAEYLLPFSLKVI